MIDLSRKVNGVSQQQSEFRPSKEKWMLFLSSIDNAMSGQESECNISAGRKIQWVAKQYNVWEAGLMQWLNRKENVISKQQI